MSLFSQKAEYLVGNEIVKFGNEINERIRKGETIYNLTIGDFNPAVFPIPEVLREQIIEAYRQGHTNYPPGDGLLELREAVSAFIEHYQGLSYGIDEILISSGSRPLIYALYQTVLDPNDYVIFPVPSWNNNHYTHLSSARQVIIPAGAGDGFMPSAKDIAPHMHDAALLALCSPLNPTGTCFTANGLREICELVAQENAQRIKSGRKPVYILYDQVYSMLTFGGTQHVDPVRLIPELRPYTLFVDGVSKAFAGTGVRVGWSFGPAPLINKMKAILTHVGAWAPKAEQVATARFLQQRDAVNAFLTHFRQEVEIRLNALYAGIQSMKAEGFQIDAVSPQGAIYLTVKFDLVGGICADGTMLSSHKAVHQYLLDAAKVAIVPFSSFGTDPDTPWYRISVGTCRKEDIPVIISGLRRALSELRMPSGIS